MATPGQHAAWVLAAALLGGCLRPLLGDEAIGDAGSEGSSTGEADRDGLSASDTGVADDESESGDVPIDPEPTCHPSYDPCLPIVDDLNCPDVVALGAAPVQVIGPDDYRLDTDHDGIGCES